VHNTLNILPRIFGVHISHNPIPLDFGFVSEQFTKEVISEARKHAFRNLGIDKRYFCSLDSGKSFGFCWVFLPMLMLDSGSQSLTIHGVRGIRRRVRA
jgi:hypothetical protein